MTDNDPLLLSSVISHLIVADVDMVVEESGQLFRRTQY